MWNDMVPVVFALIGLCAAIFITEYVGKTIARIRLNKKDKK